MRKLRLALMMAAVCNLGIFVTSTFGQGSLTPPGAPAPTMKTLQQIEPRVPITNAPFTISAPGSYYLTTNLISTSHGVYIQSSGVTLDLMGFMLSGDCGGTDFGIYLDGATNALLRDVCVRNGIISRFGYGIYCEYGMNCRFEQLAVSSNSNYGIQLYGAYSGQCNGNSVAHCAIGNNSGYGVALAGGYSGQCDGNSVTHCAIGNNSDIGLYLYGGNSGQCNGNTVADCAISGNGNNGVLLSGSAGGQCDGNTVVNCTIRKNVDEGIALYSADGNRIEGNHISGQTGAASTYGIYTDSVSQKNMIFRNTCVGQTTNFSLNANDTYGPIVTNTGALPSSGDAAHPWANFSR